MFEELKKKRRAGLSAKALTAWFMFGAIILVFVLNDQLNPSSAGVGQGGAAAEVNNVMISDAEVVQAAENLSRNPRYAALELDRSQLQGQALDELIRMQLVSQGARRQGLRVSDAQVRDSIVEIPAFQDKDGRFRRDQYMMYLQQVRQSAGEFEAGQREHLLRQRTARLIQAALRPAEIEVTQQKAVQDLKANAEFLLIPGADATSGAGDALVKPTSIPAVDVASFLGTPESEKKVKDYYESHLKSEYTQGEEVRARHILIKAERGNKDKEKAAMAKIESIQKRLAKNEDFGKIAREMSEDEGSKIKGGDLGFFGRARMVEEFEKAAFSLDVKKVSAPIQTSYGFHLIEVLEKRPAKVTSYEEARDGIARKMIASERTEKAVDEVRELVKKGDMDAISQWAKNRNLKWEETGPFSIEASSVPKVGPNTEFADAAFRLTREKPLLDRLIRQGPHTYVVRYKAVPPEKASGKEKDLMNQFMKPEFMREMMANQRTNEAFDRWIKQLRTDSKISVAKRYGLESRN